jgi:hypothetical protein
MLLVGLVGFWWRLRSPEEPDSAPSCSPEYGRTARPSTLLQR